MFSIRESDLPGIGHKFQMDTTYGDKLVVVIHDDGKRQIFFFDPENHDEYAGVATLDDEEARKLAAIIGGMTYTPKALQSLEIELDDLVIDWYRVPPQAKAAGKSIGQLQLRQRTGASVIAILDADKKGRLLNPGPDEVVHEGATLVVVGTRENLKALKDLIVNGS